MRLALLSLAAATLFCSATAANATGFEELRRVCLDTQADPRAALSAADARGWTLAPTEIVRAVNRPGFPEGSRWKREGTRFLVMFAELKSDNGGSFRVCRMIARPGETAVAEEASKWAALPPFEQEKGWVSYQFYDADGRHLTGNQDALFGSRMAAKAHFRTLGIETTPSETFMSFIVPNVSSGKSAS